MRRLLVIGFWLLAIGWARPLVAAELKVVASQDAFKPGEDFLVQLTIETDQPANAISGSLIFPPDLLTVLSIHDGNSVVNFWIKQPAVSEAGVIHFAGMTPGGMLGANEVLFTVAFQAGREGAGEVTAADIELLLNDGQATPLSAELIPWRFAVSAEEPSRAATPAIEDEEPPEDFVIHLANDQNLFEGRTFAVFSTQDKGSGMDRYEVKEGLWGSYVEATSPYVLKDQSQKRLAVKAIDNAGNERVVTIGAEGDARAYQQRAVKGAIIVMVAVAMAFMAAGAVWRRLRK